MFDHYNLSVFSLFSLELVCVYVSNEICRDVLRLTCAEGGVQALIFYASKLVEIRPVHTSLPSLEFTEKCS